MSQFKKLHAQDKAVQQPEKASYFFDAIGGSGFSCPHASQTFVGRQAFQTCCCPQFGSQGQCVSAAKQLKRAVSHRLLMRRHEMLDLRQDHHF